MRTIESLPPPMGTTRPGTESPDGPAGIGRPEAGGRQATVTGRGTGRPLVTANSRSPSS